MDFDIYSRTSISTHHQNAQEFFLSFYNQGLLKEKKTMQFFDAKVNMFLPDRYVEGTCPKCGYEEARSDECEKCGALYEPNDLLNPISKISGTTPTLKETSHWFFPLGKFQERLQKYIEKKNDKYQWKPNVLSYCKSWFNDGLKDRAVTRDLNWGIKVPLENAEGKVLYVWFEAVLGYISASMQLSKNLGDEDLWRKYWQDEDTRYIAFIGKDNVVFHTIIFPAMLMAWNDGNENKFVLPENVPANEFLNFEGKKFSKSRSWGIDVHEFLELFPADPLRYALAANLPENKDTDFYWREFQLKNNSELADILGNFINRTFTFVHKNYEGKVPKLDNLGNIDTAMLDLLKETPKKIGRLIEKYKIKDAVFEMMNLARAGNKYFNDSEPWKIFKSDKQHCGTTLNICLQTIYTLAEVFAPVIPFSSEKIFKMLNAEKTVWGNSGEPNLPDGHKLNEPEIVFKKIEDDIIKQQMNKLGSPDTTEVEEYNVEQITFDDFSKIDLRTAEILSAEKIKKSNKLLKLKVDLGFEKRQVVGGLAKAYKPENLIGKKIILVANLKPAKLMGVESQGMVLAIEDENGKLSLVETNNELKPGLKVS